MAWRDWCVFGLVLPLGIGLGASSCSDSSGGGGGGGNSMAIVSCSLSCTEASSVGDLFSCGITDVYVNQEIRITFSKGVNLNSVTSNSFQIQEDPGGTTPPGTFSVDPTNSRVLVYRPQLTFDSSGNPIFGLNADATYKIFVPGTELDSGQGFPFITSTDFSQNRTRLDCTVVASRGVFDASPGAPQQATTVDVVDVLDMDGDGDTTEIIPDQPAQGAMFVSTDSDIVIEFNDVMNPATLANPVSGESDTVTVMIDPDGDTTDPSDQIPLQGSFTLTIDQLALKTTLSFTPSGGLPSSGTPPTQRKIVVNLAPSIADLGGNTLLNAGNVIFTPERLIFAPTDLTETFDTTTLEDSSHTGVLWNGTGALLSGADDDGDGSADRPLGGGSGQLGDLIIPSGVTITLNTDLEDFSAPDLQDPLIFDIESVIDVGNPATFTVAGGVFEFSRLRIDAGGVLRLEGSNPGRIYVRGEVIVQGRIDVAGRSALIHDPTDELGGGGGIAGPGGGDGGDGGLRPDGANFVAEGGVPSMQPGSSPADPFNPADYAALNGQDGGGIPFPNTLMRTDLVTEGLGGAAWPQPVPGGNPNDDTIHFPVDPMDTTAFPWEETAGCQITVPGGAGSGGGYSLSGFTAVTGFLDTAPPVQPPRPTDVVGGDSSDLGIDPAVRSLSPEDGLLRGGGGGGGGGAHLTLSSVNGQVGVDCDIAVGGGALQINSYVAASSGGGGGAGGGFQTQAGRRIVLNGVVDGSGGDGGSGVFPDIAQPGGAGGGGGILLQAPAVSIQAVPSRINVRGGFGGSTLLPPNAGSFGGDGGPGFLRLEKFNVPLDPTLLVDAEKSKVVPTEVELQTRYGMGVDIDDIFTAAEWLPPSTGPSARSGAQSCWVQPQGNFFQLVFVDDILDTMDVDGDGDTTEILTPGWDMRLLTSVIGSPLVSYRLDGQLPGLPGTSIEEFFGSDLGAAPVVVRFQGARAIGDLVDPCTVPLVGIDSLIVDGSLTGWVKHPAELNTFHMDASLTPNIFRFTIVWDRGQAGFANLLGVEDVTVSTRPD